MLLPLLLFQIFPALLIHSAKLYYGDFSVFSSPIYNLTLSFFPYIFFFFSWQRFVCRKAAQLMVLVHLHRFEDDGKWNRVDEIIGLECGISGQEGGIHDHYVPRTASTGNCIEDIVMYFIELMSMFCPTKHGRVFSACEKLVRLFLALE